MTKQLLFITVSFYLFGYGTPHDLMSTKTQSQSMSGASAQHHANHSKDSWKPHHKGGDEKIKEGVGIHSHSHGDTEVTDGLIDYLPEETLEQTPHRRGQVSQSEAPPSPAISPFLAPAVSPRASPSYHQGSTTPSPWFKRFFEVAGQVPNRRSKRALKAVLSNPQKFRFQLLITEIDHLDSDQPEFTVHDFRVDQEYFYPASAIKTYASLAALMYYTELKSTHPWLTTNDALSYDKKSCLQKDKSNVHSQHVTLEHEIKKTQLVSKNQAFNRVFNVLGSREIHRRLLPYFPSLRVYHRLSTNESYDECLKIPSIHICNSNSKGEIDTTKDMVRPRFVEQRENVSPTLFQGPLYSPNTPVPYTGLGAHTSSLNLGKGYRDPHTKKRISEPMNFSWKNRASFYDFQRLTLAIYNPDLPDPIWRANPHGTLFDKSKVRRVWLNELRHAMAIYPRRSDNPVYTSASLSETRFKPLIRGMRMNKKAGRSLIKDDALYYLNKAGKAFGFHIDNALIIVGKGKGNVQKSGKPGGQRKASRALLITVGVYANDNQILNDNRYEYKTITVPLLDAIGYAVGRYLLK